MTRQTIAVDFDGVLHSYTSPWIAAHAIPDPPVDGAIEWLHGIVQHFDVYILSTRCKTWRGRRAVRAWLRKHSGNLFYDAPGHHGIERVGVSFKKLPAIVYVDDRAYRFDGRTWPSVGALRAMVPWGKVPRVRDTGGET